MIEDIIDPETWIWMKFSLQEHPVTTGKLPPVGLPTFRLSGRIQVVCGEIPYMGKHIGETGGS